MLHPLPGGEGRGEGESQRRGSSTSRSEFARILSANGDTGLLSGPALTPTLSPKERGNFSGREQIRTGVDTQRAICGSYPSFNRRPKLEAAPLSPSAPNVPPSPRGRGQGEGGSRRGESVPIRSDLSRTLLGHPNNGLLFALLLLLLSPLPLCAASPETVLQTNLPGRMITKENQVEYLPAQRPPMAAPTNQWLDYDDALRTLVLGRATVRLTDLTEIALRDRSRLDILRQPDRTNSPALQLTDGELYISSRGGDQPVPVVTPHVHGTPKGTEFLVRVDAARTEFVMFHGTVDLRTTPDSPPVPVQAGEVGIAIPGQPIHVAPIVEAKNIVQWWLYYPAVLNPDELSFAPADLAALAPSRLAYRSGHLSRALQLYPGFPTPAPPTSDGQRLYFAALLLSVGAVDRAEQLIVATADKNAPPALALRLMIYAVTNGVGGGPFSGPILNATGPASSSGLLALSYAHQSTNNLHDALAAAEASTIAAPAFGFAWARVAELEFSLGQTRRAHAAVERALTLSPSNAQAHCVQGFLLAARHRVHEALESFNRAIELDSSLGNAWLGRGLCQRRLGLGTLPSIANRKSKIANDSWLSDLQTAAILEPRRSLIRAYAGKAFSDAGNARLAMKELDYAAQLDPNDPTPPLYRALELYQQNRPNEAVRELERSVELNDNRAVYRSRLLLDQDHATRGASLAKIYQAAGLEDVALREAARAVSYDYASHSAHQFLAESYNALRDPTRFNLRYETVWFNELLLANILSPVGAGLLSQNISQQEYSRLFEANRLGLLTSTEVRSDGQYREIASHYGLVDRLAYTLDLDYQHNNGTRPNNDLDRIEWYSQLKYQLTDRDSIFLLTKYQDYESGDNFQRYDPATALKRYHFIESQAPLATAAIHREWSPGNHTTILGARLATEQALVSGQSIPRLLTTADPNLFSFLNFSNLTYRSALEIYQLEMNQIFQTERQTWVFGGRYQTGEFRTQDQLSDPRLTNPGFAEPSNALASVRARMRRTSAYAYYTLTPSTSLRLSTGLSHDRIEFPTNFRFPPISGGTSEREELLPKAAFVWDPMSWLTFRGVYSEFLSGVSLEESFRLEPTQLAGFGQAYRTVISEAEAGSTAAPKSRLGGLALDCKPSPGTYAGIEWQSLSSQADQRTGVFLQSGSVSVARSTIRERLNYAEETIGFSVQQLIGFNWTVGFAHHLTRSDLNWSYPGLVANNNPTRTEDAMLHRTSGRINFVHPAGWFGRFEADWFRQSNHGYPNSVHHESRSPEEFCQLNLWAGLRFARRRGEVTVGALNLTDQSFHLNSLTPYADLPRERVFVARLRLDF